jgi:hypothetical protein
LVRAFAESQAALIFVAILPPGGLVQARYLCKRLSRRFPHLKILVGHWGRIRYFDRLLVQLRSAGASYVTTSLLQSASQVRALRNPVTRPALGTAKPGADSGPPSTEARPVLRSRLVSTSSAAP